MARQGQRRVTAAEAHALQGEGALLVDTRTGEQRTRDGGIPGAVVIDRTVLEWRLDPQCPSHCPQAGRFEDPVVVLCNEGYSSSLAAQSLRAIGRTNVTDVIGGFQAWKAAGLPVVPP
jgi:rhodanese-related sulfurtransferase